MPKKAGILIVDKEKMLIDLLSRALSSPEVHVFGATTAEQGARVIDVHAPDILVIDPSIDNGLLLLSSLNSSKVKILAIVASEEIRERTKALPIQGVVDRNDGYEALVEAIRAILPADLVTLGEAEPVKIMICDDDPEVRSLLSDFLMECGYTVSVAKNGQQALDRIEHDHAIRIVLLDVGMPIIGGIDVLSQIMRHNPHPSVIMLTGIADHEIARQATKTGAFDYILKPFDFPTIESSITACLGHSEYQKQPLWKRLMRGSRDAD
jgi:DNA-binding NtrC family response regulator